MINKNYLKKAQIASGLTWFVAFLIIFFIILVFIGFAAGYAKLSGTGVSYIDTDSSSLRNFWRTKNIIYGMEQMQTYDSAIPEQPGKKMLINLVEKIKTKSPPVFKVDNLVYPQNLDPYMSLTDDEAKMMKLVLKDIAGYSEPCVNAYGFISYPIIGVFEMSPSNIPLIIIDYHPEGQNIKGVSLSHPEEVNIRTILANNAMGIITFRISTTVTEEEHAKNLGTLPEICLVKK